MSKVWNGLRMVHKRNRNQASQQLKRNKLLKQRGSICEHCGFEGYVEMHHKVRVVDGGTFDNDNLELLCVENGCHQKADKLAREAARRG